MGRQKVSKGIGNAREISMAEAEALVRRCHPKGLNPDVSYDDLTVEKIREASIRGADISKCRLGGKMFVLTWKGARDLRGCHLLGHEIGMTIKGLVLSTTGEEIGVYDRLVDAQTPKQEHLMIIYLYPTA